MQHHEIYSQKVCDSGRYVTILWRRTASHPLRHTGTGDTNTGNTSNAVSQYSENQSLEEGKQKAVSRNVFITKYRCALDSGQCQISLRVITNSGSDAQNWLKCKEGKFPFHLTFVIVFLNYLLIHFIRFHRMATCDSNEQAADLHKSSPLPVTYTKVSTQKLSTFSEEMPSKQPYWDTMDKAQT